MKRIVLAAFVLGIASVSASAPAVPDVPQPPGTGKVAIVNIGYVFNNYYRAKKFKQELEDAVDPYKKKGKALADQIKAWETTLKAEDFTDQTEQQLKDKIVAAKRQLEDMATDMQRLLGKKQEANLVTLWKEVQAGIKTYATQHGIELVLGYGDPMDHSVLDMFPNINRKMQAMDLGSTAPLFATSRVEIAQGVTELLNKKLREKGG